MDTRELDRLESIARQLEPSAAQRIAWSAQTAQFVSDLIEALPGSKVYSPDTDGGAVFRETPIQEGPRPFEAVLAAIDAGVMHNGINPASGGHLGYVPGGGVFPAALGDYLAAASNRYAGIFYANPGAVRVENALLRWMCQVVGYPDGALGNLASGGSIANLIAITTAREAHGLKAADYDKAAVYLSAQTHHCVQKSLRMAGMGEAPVRYVPMDEHYRMQPDALREMVRADRRAGLRPFMLVGSAGTTDTGAIDPLDALADIAQEEQLWFHVDGAYGGFFILADNVKHLLKGIERSDSLAIDPHKGLFIPYGLGAVLIRNVEAQFRAHHYTAHYLQDALEADEELSPADLSPELTRHFRGLRLWLPLQVFGVAPFRAALEEKVLLCRHAWEQLQAMGFETGPFPDLSICIFRYIPPSGDPDAFNEALLHYVQQDGRAYLSSTRISGAFWIRFAVLSFRTHRREVDQALDILREGVAALL